MWHIIFRNEHRHSQPLGPSIKSLMVKSFILSISTGVGVGRVCIHYGIGEYLNIEVVAYLYLILPMTKGRKHSFAIIRSIDSNDVTVDVICSG